MVGWLEAALASSTARWKIVIGHHPLWSTAGSKFEQAKALRRLILPTLCRYADLYLAGHEHTLEVHTDDCSAALPEPSAPLPQVVSGSAAKMRPTNSAFIRHQLEANPQLHTLWARGLTWGFAHLTFEGDTRDRRMVETPRDGSGTTQVTYEHSFARRSWLRTGEHAMSTTCTRLQRSSLRHIRTLRRWQAPSRGASGRSGRFTTRRLGQIDATGQPRDRR